MRREVGTRLRERKGKRPDGPQYQRKLKEKKKKKGGHNGNRNMRKCQYDRWLFEKR